MRSTIAAPEDSTLTTWRINDRLTTFLVRNLPTAIWASALPGSPRRPVRSIAAHLHNSRRLWMRGLAVGTGLALPDRVDPLVVTRQELLAALDASGRAILLMLQAGLENGGEFPGVSAPFFFGAMPRNVALFTAYALSHEAHHRGQLLLMARELGHRLPANVVAGLWQWSSRLKESSTTGPARPRR